MTEAKASRYARHRGEMNYNYFPIYSPERQQMQDQILDYYLAHIPAASAQPRALFSFLNPDRDYGSDPSYQIPHQIWGSCCG